MRKTINSYACKGVLYSHNLTVKVTGESSKNPGTEYISGVINIAVDKDKKNIIPIHYTYVVAVNSNTGKVNPNFSTLKKIANGTLETYVANPEKAALLSVYSSIGLNEFYSDRNGEEELVSVKRNDNGYIIVLHTSLDESPNPANLFECDMVITGVRHVDATEDYPEKSIIRGCIFGYKNAALPVEFSVLDVSAMNYFDDLEPSKTHPVFTKIRGHQVSEQSSRKVVEENAFGDDFIREVPTNHKDYIIDWAQKDTYAEIDADSEDLTVEEFTKIMQDRELYLATLKERNEEYKASRATTSTISTTPSAGTFDF